MALRRNKQSKLNVLSIELLLNGTSRTASQILSAVQTAIAQHDATQVTTVGHSLGVFKLEFNFPKDNADSC